MELRQERPQRRGEVLRQLEEILESRGNIPRVRPLVEHQRQHRRQRKTVRLVMLGENLHHVAQQPQRHRWVRAALVLEEEIQQSPAPAHAHRKQQVRVHLLEAGLDERAGQHRQRRPVDPDHDLRRQMALEKRHGMLRLREDRLEKPVMRMRRGDGTVSGCFHSAEGR